MTNFPMYTMKQLFIYALYKFVSVDP